MFQMAVGEFSMQTRFSFRSAISISALSFVCALAIPSTMAAGQSTFTNWESPQTHSVELTPSGNILLVVNTPDAKLEVFDIVKGALQKRGSVSVGLDPVSVRARTETEAWVVNQISDSVSVVDLATMRVVRTINVGDEPADVIFAGSLQRAFVSLAQPSQLAVINPATPSAAATILTIAGSSPRALAVSPDGSKVYLAIFESGNHSTIVPRSSVSSTSSPYGGQNPPPNSGNLFSPARTAGQATPPRVNQIVRKNAAGQWMDGNARNWSSFVTWDVHDHDIAVIDANTLGISYINGLMTTLTALAVAPNGTLLAIGMESRNELRFEQNVNGVFIQSKGALLVGGAGPGTVVDLNPHLTYATASVPLITRLQSIGDPRGAVWNAVGTTAYVAGLGSNNVIAMGSTGARIATILVGEGPTGLALSPNGQRLYVLNRFEGAVSVVDTTSNSEIARLPLFDPTPVAVKQGRPFLFDTHMTSGLGQASCASCHTDGRSDRIAWDIGNPQGSVLLFDETCQVPGCQSWHPMKGPMTSQTLLGIIGNEPFHWRGEKKDLADFNEAYTHLQGRDAQITTDEMAKMTTYVASLTFPPNPNRNIDSSLKTSIALATGTGNAVSGLNIFTNVNTFGIGAPGGPFKCVTCHSGTSGSNHLVDIPGGANPTEQQNRKNAPLRDVYRNVGANRASLTANRGFGFDHDGEESTLQEVLAEGFTFSAGATGVQQKKDVEAYLLSFGTDTHGGVGAQSTASNAGGTGDDSARIAQMITLATANQVGLIVKGRVAGIARGWTFVSGTFQSDRSAESIAPAALLALAASGSELTYTLVGVGSQTRLGIDRDLDGAFDRDEIDAGTDPADASSHPVVCIADIAGGDRIVGGSDLATLLSNWGAAGGVADINRDMFVDGHDMAIMLSSWGPCS